MKPKYPIRKLVTVNFLAILAAIGFQFLISNVQNPKGDGAFQPEFRNLIIGIVIMTAISILNLIILLVFERIPVFHSKKSERNYYLLTSYVLNVPVFILIIILFTFFFQHSGHISGIVDLMVIGAFANTWSLFIQNYVILQDTKLNAEMENSRLKAANAEAANLLLRQQIHPHFLFNSLNVLKSLYKKDPDKAEEYLVCLSDFLRAAISNNNIRIIRLNDELKLCLDYLELQKIRFGEALVCSVNISSERLENGFVPSFSVQPLIENAIKHNELTAESPLHLSIEQDGDRVKVSNNLKLKNSTEKSTGSGLANLSERYRLLSGDELIIEENNDNFSVSIRILNSENHLENCSHQIYNMTD
jgi:sensor histidine kinase YesM